MACWTSGRVASHEERVSSPGPCENTTNAHCSQGPRNPTFVHLCSVAAFKMPPKQSTSAGAASRGRPAGSKNKVDKSSVKPTDKGKGKQRAVASESPEPEASHRHSRNENEQEHMNVDREAVASNLDENEDEQEKTIPPDLLTRILAEFFEQDGTRITKDANSAVAKYMDVFVKEAIARAAAERFGGFLEVR